MEQLATKKEPFHGLPSGISELFSLGPKLADGPSSQLIEAEDRQTGETGLLKVLDLESFGVAERHRILREWSRQQKLVTASEVVVAPLRCGQTEGVIWQFRNNIPGIPLDVVIEDGPLPMGDAIAIAAQVALGLSELHGEGFLHRDLKPEHILFRGRGKNGPRVAVIDAGVSVSIPVKSPYPIFGTVGYVSPEQIAGRLVSFRSDLYALGCVFYEMLTGKKPFLGDDIESILQQHASAERPELPRGLPQTVARLLLSMLDRSPRNRPHSADQVFRTLSPFTDDGVRKSPSIKEGEGEEMQRKIDLGVSDSEELRRATLLGMPSQPSKSKRPPPPPAEALGASKTDEAKGSVPSAKALSGASTKPEVPVREELTNASVAGPPPINAPGYHSKAPAAKVFPAVNAPGYSSVAPSGLLDLNVPLEDLDYDDLEDTDAVKARYEAERDTSGTLVDIPRDPNGTAMLAFDEIEPVEEDDIVSASKAPADIFEGVDFRQIDDVGLDDVRFDEEGPASEVDEALATAAHHASMFESFEAPEPPLDGGLGLELEEAEAGEASLDLPSEGSASAPVISMPPALPGGGQPSSGGRSIKKTLSMGSAMVPPAAAPASLVSPPSAHRSTQPTGLERSSASPSAPQSSARSSAAHSSAAHSSAAHSSAAHSSTAHSSAARSSAAPNVPVPSVAVTSQSAPSSNRAILLAALIGTFVGTLVLGAVAWWLGGSNEASQVAASTEQAPANVAALGAAPQAPAETSPEAQTRDEKSGAEAVRILPLKSSNAKSSRDEERASRSRSSSRSRRERRAEAAAAPHEAPKAPPATLGDVAKAAAAREAEEKTEKVSAAPTEASRPEGNSVFDQMRERAKQAFVARRYDEAAALYQRATTMNPRHAGSFAGLGASRLAQGDARGAALAYIKAVNLAPQNSRYFVALGHSYLRAGDRANAKRAYEKALSINPNLKSAQIALQKL